MPTDIELSSYEIKCNNQIQRNSCFQISETKLVCHRETSMTLEVTNNEAHDKLAVSHMKRMLCGSI